MTAKEEKTTAWQALKPWVFNPIVSPLVVKAVIAIAATIFAIATTIVGGWGTVGKAIAGLLGYRVPVPVWLLAPMLVALVAFVVRLIINHLRESQKPDYLQYTEGEFFAMLWCWEWDANGAITDLTPFCPDDDTRLVPFGVPDDSLAPFIEIGPSKETKFFCDTCKKTFGPLRGQRSDTLARVVIQIDRKKRTGEWKTTATEATDSTDESEV